MRIVIVTQDAPVYLPQFMDGFLEQLDRKRHSVAAIVVSEPFAKNSRWSEIVARFNFYGAGAFCRMMRLILSNKLKSALFKLFPAVGSHSMSNIIAQYSLRRLQFREVNSKRFRSFLRQNEVDLVISVAAPQIFKRKLLATPPRGCINYHSALLPKYRGRQPLFWALLNGETEVGVTVHEMDEKLDNGAIIAQSLIPVRADDSLHKLYLRTIAIGAGVLVEAVEKLARGDAARLPNDPEKATYYSFPTKEDAMRFRAGGKRFF